MIYFLESLTQAQLVELVESLRAKWERVAAAEYRAKRYSSTARKQAMAALRSIPQSQGNLRALASEFKRAYA